LRKGFRVEGPVYRISNGNFRNEFVNRR
jgi:hypothetical protein